MLPRAEGGDRAVPVMPVAITGRVVGTMTLDVLDGRIQTIRSVVNPDKLGHVGPVGDGWAVAREIKQAKRSTH